jgi:hypothetical protein
MTQYRHISIRSISQKEKNLWFNIILTAKKSEVFLGLAYMEFRYPERKIY